MPLFLRAAAALLFGLALPSYKAYSAPIAVQEAPAVLAGFVEEALRASPELKRAKAAVEAAEALHAAAGQPLYNPELAFEAERADVDTTTAGVSQSLDWNGKREGRSSVAAADLMAARARYADTRLTLASRVLSALAGHQASAAVETLAKGRVDLMQRLARLAAQRQAAGDLEWAELNLARLALSEAQLQHAGATAALAEAEEALIALFTTAPPWPELPSELPAADTFTPAALRTLPAIRAAEAAVLAARERVGLRRLERRPDPTVGLWAGTEGSESLVGLSLSLPVFVRNSFDAEVQAAEAELTRAQQAAQVLVQQAEARREAAARRYRTAQAAWRQWQVTGDVALGHQGELLERLWRAGEIDTANYLVQLRQALDTREAAVSHRGRAWRAWFQWLEASGRTLAWAGLDGLNSAAE